MTPYLDSLNQYSNLILILINILLIAITARYVQLTGKMVMEMRQAREAETEPNLVIMPVPYTPMHVKLRIQNTGSGPALNIAGLIVLRPEDSPPRHWSHPALISDAFIDFKLPDCLSELDYLSSRYNEIKVNLTWENIFGRRQSSERSINLKKLKDGWFGARILLPPDDISTQLSKVATELSEIKDELKANRFTRNTASAMEGKKLTKYPKNRIAHMVKRILNKLKKL